MARRDARRVRWRRSAKEAVTAEAALRARFGHDAVALGFVRAAAGARGLVVGGRELRALL